MFNIILAKTDENISQTLFWITSHCSILLPSAVCDPGNICVTEAPKHPVSEEVETPIKDSHLIPTPQAPSIAFPLANPPVAPHPREKVC